MATDRSNKTEPRPGTQGSSNVAVRRGPEGSQQMRRWDGDRYTSGPFAVMRQMQNEMDHWFERMGLGRGWTSPSSWMSRTAEHIGDWMPAVDAFQRGNEFVIRADVPGMTRNDLTVEVGDETVTIRGERKQEQSDEREGMYWSERSYGSFSRTIPLPPGTITDSAKANFHNGVLEVVMQAPSQEARRGRKVDITGHDHTTGEGGKKG
jgi:HSP20 family protein